MVAEAGLEPSSCCGARHLPASSALLGICRPLPLAQVAPPATGGAPFAPLREPGDRFECCIITKKNTIRLDGVLFGCGGRTRTYDLRVMRKCAPCFSVFYCIFSPI